MPPLFQSLECCVQTSLCVLGLQGCQFVFPVPRGPELGAVGGSLPEGNHDAASGGGPHNYCNKRWLGRLPEVQNRQADQQFNNQSLQ